MLQYGETVMSKLEQLRAEGAIGGYDLISIYLPSRRTQQERQKILPERNVLQRNVETALEDLPFAPGLFAPFLMRSRPHAHNRRSIGGCLRERRWG